MTYILIVAICAMSGHQIGCQPAMTVANLTKEQCVKLKEKVQTEFGDEHFMYMCMPAEEPLPKENEL